MCIITGYIGLERAAPILIDMLRKTEGMDAGCFTGLATIHEGKIHYRKLAGNLDHFLANSDAMDLPGNIGIMHSRTPGGSGEDSWAHPFTCEVGGEVKTALVANGVEGCCKERRSIQAPTAIARVTEAGYELKSLVPFDHKENHIPQLTQDGMMTHNCDLICQNISMKVLNGSDTVTALCDSYRELSFEQIGLLLSVTEPEAISYTRLNMPMFVGMTENATYLATAPMAFADVTLDAQLLPALSAGKITRGGFSCKKMPDPPFTVAPITPQVWNDAYERIVEKLKKGERGFSTSYLELFPEADCTPKNAVMWAVLSDLHRQGKLEIIPEYLPGVRDDLLKTKFNYRYKE